MLEHLLFNFILKRTIINIDLLSLDFKSTDNTDFNRNGDYYVEIDIGNNICYYIIDYGLSNNDRFMYNPNYIVKQTKKNIRTEVIVFKNLYQNNIKKILGFHSNSYYKFKIYYMNDKMDYHNINGPSVITYKQNGDRDKEYYLNGKKLEEKPYYRMLKINKILENRYK